MNPGEKSSSDKAGKLVGAARASERWGIAFAHPNLDAHCHLQHDPSFSDYVKCNSDQQFFCMTETPEEYGIFRARFRAEAFPPNVFLGLGLHPWSVSENREEASRQIETFCACLNDASAAALGRVASAAALGRVASAAALGQVTPIAAHKRKGLAKETSTSTSDELPARVFGEPYVRAHVRFESLRFLLIGEVGLDFSAKHVGARENQLEAFRAIARACNRVATETGTGVTPGSGAGAGSGAGSGVTTEAGAEAATEAVSGCNVVKPILSLHAVQSTGQVLDILHEAGCLDSCFCIFHWFSGTGEQLLEARRAGCLFSFGTRALATKRGRAYAAQIPANRLLFESDAYRLDDAYCKE